jgi:hypothetical protein
MNDFPAVCPCCGSRQLISGTSNRKIYISHAGERIPLLTVNFCLDRPVFEETAKIYRCSCSWQGTAGEDESGTA